MRPGQDVLALLFTGSILSSILKFLAISLVIHFLIIATFQSSHKAHNFENKKFLEILVEAEPTKQSKSNTKIQVNKNIINSIHKLSSRAVKGIFDKSKSAQMLNGSGYFGITNENAKELLFTEPKVMRAFDQLAQKVNFYLEYPLLLVEDGISGNASLDLYFDYNGMVDEDRSIFSGSNKFVRGLLVKATRDGLLKWYETDGTHLRTDEFRNQYFHVDFEISYTQDNVSKFEKLISNTYSFTRRQYRHVCANPAGVDLACVAMKTYGVINKAVSPEFKIKLSSLKERLEYFDQLGLKNINTTILTLKI